MLSPSLWLDVDEVSLMSPSHKFHTGAFLDMFHPFLYQLCLHFSCLDEEQVIHKSSHTKLLNLKNVSDRNVYCVHLFTLTVVRRESVCNIDMSVHWLGPEAAPGEADFGTLSSSNGNVSLSETGGAVYDSSN